MCRVLKLFALITELDVIYKPEFQGMKWDITGFMLWGLELNLINTIM